MNDNLDIVAGQLWYRVQWSVVGALKTVDLGCLDLRHELAEDEDGTFNGWNNEHWSTGAGVDAVHLDDGISWTEMMKFIVNCWDGLLTSGFFK